MVLGAIVIGSGLITSSPTKAQGSGDLFWDDDGSTFASFGPNESVTIAFGTIGFDCDGFFPTADIYVLSSVPSAGGSLSDVSGVPNSVFGSTGGLFSDTIAFTRPTGNLGRGTYTVVYDECQNGRLDAEDSVFVDTFEVREFSDVPPLDPVIGALKARAGETADRYEALGTIIDSLERAQQLQEALACATGPAQCIVDAITGQITDALLEQLKLVLGVPTADPKVLARDVLADNVTHYRGIEADPPDPAFRQTTTLGSVDVLRPEGSDPRTLARFDLANAQAQEAVLAEALLHAIERYQGADVAGAGSWARVHARQASDLASLLAAQLAETSTSLSRLRSAIADDPGDLDHVSATASEAFAELDEAGLPAETAGRLLNLGFSTNQVAEAVTTLAGDGGLGAFSEADVLAGVDDAAAANADLATALTDVAVGMDALSSQIDGDPTVPADAFPTVDAGGPYAAPIGVPVGLRASVSDPDGPVDAVAWDLDRDGAFDDASGLEPTATFDSAFDGLIGIRTIDQEGHASVAYARMTVARDRPPTATFAPTGFLARALPGDSVSFHVDAADGDGDDLDIRWRVDGEDAVAGPDFVFTPGAPDAEPQLLEAAVSDGSSTIVRRWVLAVERPASSTPPGPTPVLGGQVFSQGGDVVVEVLSAVAGFTSELHLCLPGDNLPDAPGTNTGADFIATNREIGKVKNLGSFPAGTELVFCIFVRETRETFYMGPAERNRDNIVHARVDQIDANRAIVGFEDLFGGGDRDFDDNRFRFTGVSNARIDGVGGFLAAHEGETRSVTVGAATSDAATLRALNVPPFVTFKDNGDGTALVTATPTDDADASFVVTRCAAGTCATSNVHVIGVNVPPLASAANSGPVTVGGRVTVTGSQDDPGADTFMYAFDCEGDGTSSAFRDVPTTDCSFSVPGSYEVDLIVRDDDGGIGQASTHVVVRPLPVPVAEIARVDEVDEGAFVRLDGRASNDLDGDALEFAWEQTGGPPVALSSTTVTRPTFFPPDDGTYVFQLVVNGGGESSEPAEITVRARNVAPTVEVSNSGPVKTGDPATVKADVADPGSADTFVYEFDCDGDGVFSERSEQPTTTCTFSEVGMHTVRVRVTDDDRGVALGNTVVEALVRNSEPDCSTVTPDASELWPPDHKMVAVTIGGASDADGDPVKLRIIGVTQDEPVQGPGSPHSPDAVLSRASDAVELRAERDGGGDGRVYRIAFVGDDGQGGTCEATTTVGVPHDRAGHAAIDSNGSYDSISG